jgi:phosphate starvation-inducible PhoH-like protein
LAKNKQQDKELVFYYKPRSPAQEKAAEIWDQSRIIFMLGAAGTGKTAAALGMAVGEALRIPNAKLWLSRPTVSCGETLGFLPGDLNEKLLPWLAPFFDCFGDLSNNPLEELSKKIAIEAVAVGMLRGRTIKNGFLICDEMQNATPQQIKLVLTRLGKNSKIVLCGDVDQSDLYTSKKSPLLDAAKKLADLSPTVSVVYFSDKDQLRDPLITDILTRL